MSNWSALAEQVLGGNPISADDARDIVRSSDDDLLPLLGAAFEIRQQYHGRDVRLHVLPAGSHFDFSAGTETLTR